MLSRMRMEYARPTIQVGPRPLAAQFRATAAGTFLLPTAFADLPDTAGESLPTEGQSDRQPRRQVQEDGPVGAKEKRSSVGFAPLALQKGSRRCRCTLPPSPLFPPKPPASPNGPSAVGIRT